MQSNSCVHVQLWCTPTLKRVPVTSFYINAGTFEHFWELGSSQRNCIVYVPKQVPMHSMQRRLGHEAQETCCNEYETSPFLQGGVMVMGVDNDLIFPFWFELFL